MTATTPTNIWTIAYRTPKANHFKRVPALSLTWDDANTVGMEMLLTTPDLQIEVVPTAQAEQDGHVADEDIANIRVESGRRVKIRETGVLPETITVPGAEQPTEDAAPAAAPEQPAEEPKVEAAPKPKAKAAPKATAKAKAAKPAAKPAPKRTRKAAPAEVPAPVDASAQFDPADVTVIADTEGGKRDLIAKVDGKVIAKAVGYNATKPNGARWFKGWKIMSADGQRQLGHVVFQVGTAKATARLQEHAAAELVAA